MPQPSADGPARLTSLRHRIATGNAGADLAQPPGEVAVTGPSASHPAQTASGPADRANNPTAGLRRTGPAGSWPWSLVLLPLAVLVLAGPGRSCPGPAGPGRTGLPWSCWPWPYWPWSCWPCPVPGYLVLLPLAVLVLLLALAVVALVLLALAVLVLRAALAGLVLLATLAGLVLLAHAELLLHSVLTLLDLLWMLLGLPLGLVLQIVELAHCGLRPRSSSLTAVSHGADACADSARPYPGRRPDTSVPRLSSPGPVS